MRPQTRFSGQGWTFFMIFILVSLAFAQSNNREAARWFNIGLKERNDYQAIEAYKKAIASDPKYIEAMVNLGMRFKRVGDWEQARLYLEQALSKAPDKVNDELRFKIIYEIANIHLRKNDIRAYEKAIQNAKAATQNQNLLATLAHEHGRFLYQNKRYSEAIRELKFGLQNNPANPENFENLIALAEKEQQLDDLFLQAKSSKSDRDTKQRLHAANQGMASKTTKAVVERYYLNGLEAMNDGNYLRALASFQKAFEIDDQYKNLAEKIMEAENKLRESSLDNSVDHSNEIAVKIDSLYQSGQDYMQKNQWQKALAVFEQILAISPGDSTAIEYIPLIRTKLDLASNVTSASDSRDLIRVILLAGGAFAVLVVLPMVGAFAASPTVRVRYYLMIGNLIRAARVIERLLEQNPGRLKLYPILANVYLLGGRNDERAIKIYRTVMQLNLAKQNKQAINAILEQYYMIESGENDQDAIDILESRLREELKRKRKE